MAGRGNRGSDRWLRWASSGGLLLTGGLMAVSAALAKAASPGCAPPPAAIRDLDIPRFYGDAKGSVIDKAQLARHDAAQAPLKNFLAQVVGHADAALRKRDAKAAQCALVWIEAWAKDGAFLGTMANAQAEYQRKWDLAGLALAYLKVRSDASAAQKQSIEPWLMTFADRAHAFFDDRRHQRNNHWYWLGLGLAAVGLAADSERHWALARGIMADAARDIAANGTLPLELKRSGRALHYHAFAVMPLVLTAELGAARGEDWYGLGGGALHRLVAIVLEGLADGQVFARLAGEPQQGNAGPGSGWLWRYAARFPDRVPSPLPETPRGHRWIGGDAELLGQALAATAKR